jgi:hypothetical protein
LEHRYKYIHIQNFPIHRTFSLQNRKTLRVLFNVHDKCALQVVITETLFNCIHCLNLSQVMSPLHEWGLFLVLSANDRTDQYELFSYSPLPTSTHNLTFIVLLISQTGWCSDPN